METKKSGNRYFVMRHGEAENNVLDVCSSVLENIHPLTEKGKQQVREASQFLIDKNIDLVFCSPFLRTRETAEIVVEVINFPLSEIKIDTRLEEEKNGLPNGAPAEEALKIFADDPTRRYDEAPKDGESFVDVKKRMGDFISEVDKSYQNKNILIVSHQGAIIFLYCAINGFNKEETFSKGKEAIFKNAEIREFEFTPFPHNEKYEKM